MDVVAVKERSYSTQEGPTLGKTKWPSGPRERNGHLAGITLLVPPTKELPGHLPCFRVMVKSRYETLKQVNEEFGYLRQPNHPTNRGIVQVFMHKAPLSW